MWRDKENFDKEEWERERTKEKNKSRQSSNQRKHTRKEQVGVKQANIRNKKTKKFFADNCF